MKKRKPHTVAVLASRAHLLYRINGEKDGRKYWAYALIDPPKLEAFKKALASGTLRVQEFGNVLKWGMGSTPPTSVAAELKEKYGYDLIA